MDLSEATSITHVGFVGLGLMGKPMALNLLRAGYKVTVRSRSRGPVHELLAEGACEGANPREVALASDVVITMLPNSHDVHYVCLGENGIIHAAAGWLEEKKRRKRPEVQRWEGEGGAVREEEGETEFETAKALSEKHQIPFITIEHFEPSENVKKFWTKEWLSQRVVPIDITDNVLTVAIYEDWQLELLPVLRAKTGLKVIPVFTFSSEIKRIVHEEGYAREDDYQAIERLTVIDMSTISPKVSREIGEALGAAGIDYIEAPVSGGDIGAIKGTLSIMAGGPQVVFDRVQPIFNVLGKSAVRIGDWGAGQFTKLGNNIIAAITIESIGEAFALGAKAGVDLEKMFEAIRAGAAACWSLDHKVPKILDRDFNPGFMCRLHLKDLDLALEAGAELGVPLPVTQKVRDMFKELVDSGAGADDNCSLIRLIEKAAGVEARRPR